MYASLYRFKGVDKLQQNVVHIILTIREGHCRGDDGVVAQRWKEY